MAFLDDDQGTDLGFDVGSVERAERKEFAPVPAGPYLVEIIKTEIRLTKSKQLKQAVLTLQVFGGEHDGRLLFFRSSIASDGSNPRHAKSVAIGREQIADIFALCKLGGSDLSALVGRRLEATVVISPPYGDFGPSNEVKKFKALGGSAASPAATAKPSNVPSFLR